MEEIALKVHNSDLYGVICEIGCGQPVANALFAYPGASKTIYFAESPYSKSYQLKKFGQDEHRSVSVEKVSKMLLQYKKENPECNFVYVSSFQIGDTENKITTHGWIGLWKNDDFFYYHISIYEAMSRQQYIAKIAEIGLNLLADLPVSNVDIVIEHNVGPDHDFEKLLQNHLKSDNEENFVYFDPNAHSNNIVHRFEDRLRDSKVLTLYKGSFNPPHLGHQEVYDTMLRETGERPIFCISVNTYGKSKAEAKNLEDRIRMLLSLGYEVLITKKPYFKDLLQHLRLKYSGEVCLVMGTDTFDRYLETTPEDLNVGYAVFRRPGMSLKHQEQSYSHIENVTFYPHSLEASSTHIREILNSDVSKEIKMERLSTYLDKKIIDELLK